MNEQPPEALAAASAAAADVINVMAPGCDIVRNGWARCTV
jgi:hypothetical protein